LQIARAKEEHLQRVFEIEGEAISPPWSREALLDEMGRGDSNFIVSVDNDVKGFAIVRRVGDDGELLQIAVDASDRRSGIGDLLMSAVIEHAEESSFKSVFLEVRGSNETAICLYEKHGFNAVRVRKAYYDKPVEDAIVMVKNIN